MYGRAAANPHRTAKRLGAAGVVLVVVAVVLAGLGAFLRQAAIDSAVNDAATFDAPGELMVSGGMGERGLWVEDPKSTSQFEVTIEDETGPVPYRPFGLFARRRSSRSTASRTGSTASSPRSATRSWWAWPSVTTWATSSP